MDYFLLWTFVSKCKLVRPKACLRNEVHFKSSSYFYSKKYLKHFITKLIAIDLKLQVKLKVSIMIPPTMRPSAAWGSGDSPPLRAPGCWGPQSGWNHYGYFLFCLHFEFNLKELCDEVLEIFFAIEIRAGFNSTVFQAFHTFDTSDIKESFDLQCRF